MSWRLADCARQHQIELFHTYPRQSAQTRYRKCCNGTSRENVLDAIVVHKRAEALKITAAEI